MTKKAFEKLKKREKLKDLNKQKNNLKKIKERETKNNK